MSKRGPVEPELKNNESEEQNGFLKKRIKIEPGTEYADTEGVEFLEKVTPADKTIEINLDEDGNANSEIPGTSEERTNSIPPEATISDSSYANPLSTNSNTPASNRGPLKTPKARQLAYGTIKNLSALEIYSNSVFLCDSAFGPLVHLEEFLAKYGGKINELNVNLDVCAKDPIRFIQSLSKLCPNLERLTIRDRKKGDRLDEFYWDKKRWDEGVEFPNLWKLSISSESKLIYPLFNAIIKGSPIEKLNLNLESTTENKDQKFLNEFLTNFLLVDPEEVETIKSFKIKSDITKNRFINQEIIKRIGRLELPALKVLKIGAGIWGNVGSGDFERMLKRFAQSLEKFEVQGCYGGYFNEGYDTGFAITLPKIPKLNSFIFQPIYFYEEILENSYTPKNEVIDLEDVEDDIPVLARSREIKLFPVSIYIPPSDTLETIILGNMIELTTHPHGQGNPEICFSAFPNLEVFKVGSKWNKIAKFPSRKLELKEIQFEDGLKDPFEIQRISEAFDSIEKVSLFLPAPQVLRQFFKSFCDDHGIEELHIKTRYLFYSTLDSILRGTRARDSRLYDEDEDKKAQLLNEYGKSKEFVEFYNIEIPGEGESDDSEEKSIGDMTDLDKFKCEHIPMRLRIPRGNEHWSSPDCKFHKEFIGFPRQLITREARDLIITWIPINTRRLTDSQDDHSRKRKNDRKGVKRAWQLEEERIIKLRKKMLKSNNSRCQIKNQPQND